MTPQGTDSGYNDFNLLTEEKFNITLWRYINSRHVSYDFYRAALNAGRSRQEKTVCPLCESDCQTHELWQNVRQMSSFLYHTKNHFSLVLWEKECFMGATPSTWNFGSTGTRWSEIADIRS